MKKVLSFAIALAILLSLCSIAASAEGNSAESGGYYLIGEMTDWKPDAAYKMSLNPDAMAEEYVVRDLAVTSWYGSYQIVYSENGTDFKVEVPDQKSIEISRTETFSLFSQGKRTYDIYFRPNGNGYDHWNYNRMLYIEQTDPELKYYMLSNHVDWQRLEEKYRFTRTKRNDKLEYMLSNVELKEGDSFRAFSTEDDLDTVDYEKGSLIPDGMGWYYSIPQDGLYDVYLYPYGDGEYPGFIDNSWNNGYWDRYLVVSGPKAEGELYREKFKAQYKYGELEDRLEYGPYTPALMEYKELYYHKDQSGNTDWALVYANGNLSTPSEFYTVIANRVFNYGSWDRPLPARYAVYDVKQDMFFDAFLANDEGYPGFTRAFDSTVKKSAHNDQGRLLGDIDLDDELTILDCTLMQRCATKARDWPEDDLIKPTGFMQAKPLTYYSDFDRNGERDIVDATKLQRYVTLID